MQKIQLINELTEKMNKALEVFNNELKGLRTSRASTTLLDPVIIEAYGDKMPINRASTISTPDAQTITVQVWDKALVKTIEKAIVEANLGLNPSSDGQIIRLSVPPLSEERRKDLTKVAHKYSESTKVSIRNVRRDGIEVLRKMKKDKEISEDDYHSYVGDIQKLTDQFIDKVDNQLKVKEQEILAI